MARFVVTDTFSFSVRSRHLFVLVGDVVEGTIRVGMSLRYATAAQPAEFPILGVEFVDNLQKRTAKIGLLLPLEAVKTAGLNRAEAWVKAEYDCV